MIVSVHEYDLAPDATPEAFEAAVAEAEARELFDLPGLVEYRFLRGIKGDREGEYTAVWYYEDREAWADLWGPVGDPKPKSEYPRRWRTWEDEVVAPVLAGDPDDLRFTAYEVVGSSD